MDFWVKQATKLPAAEGASRHDGFAAGELPQWDLSDLYPAPDSQQYMDDLAQCAHDAAKFKEKYAGTLDQLAREKPDVLAAAISQYEAIEERMGRIMSYAVLVYTGDTTDAGRVKFYGDAQEDITNASAHLIFFTLELNRVDDSVIHQARKNCRELARYQPWLDDVRKDKPYQLEDRVEQLFHDKSVTGRAAWNRLFDETMATIRFSIAGESHSLEPALNFLQAHDPDQRKAAFSEIGRVLGTNARTFTLITNTLAKDKEISDRWRGFEDVAASRHLANRVEKQVVDAMCASVRGSFADISHRYYAMKAGWLGSETLGIWDRNAPLPHSKERIFGWSEARATVLDAYGGFSPEMADIASRFFDNGWIDAPVRPGKAPGAFSHPTVPSVHPYVMLNYLGRPRDVMTLAHELGHGVHQVLAADQGALMSQTPLTLAETASVFGEMLTFQSILTTADTAEARKNLLAAKVEDMLNTVVRQIAFYLYEREVHSERREGELTSERLGEIWLEVQRESLGPIFDFGQGYENYWCYIPHFVHSPFYVYAYAFGDCLVNSLYAVYQSAESGFQEKYFEMLRAGGTKHHSELLAPFGLDASDPGFWNKGLSVIAGFIDELEQLDKSA